MYYEARNLCVMKLGGIGLPRSFLDGRTIRSRCGSIGIRCILVQPGESFVECWCGVDSGFRARLPIDGRLAAPDCADRQGGLDGLRGTGKYLVFTYCSVPSIVWWVSKRSSMATSCFDLLTTRIQDGRKLGAHFRAANWEFMPVSTAPSSFATKILKLDG